MVEKEATTKGYDILANLILDVGDTNPSEFYAVGYGQYFPNWQSASGTHLGADAGFVESPPSA